VCTILWLGDLQRLHDDPELTFFFREEIGHDCTGYPPPTVERPRASSPARGARSRTPCRGPTTR
jgi:hypothetical protein